MRGDISSKNNMRMAYNNVKQHSTCIKRKSKAQVPIIFITPNIFGNRKFANTQSEVQRIYMKLPFEIVFETFSALSGSGIDFIELVKQYFRTRVILHILRSCYFSSY